MLSRVPYRTGLKGWMSRRVFDEAMNEDRFITADSDDNDQVIFLENASCHGETEDLMESLSNINTSLQFLSPNTTQKVQPLDTGILKAFKDECEKFGKKISMNS